MVEAALSSVAGSIAGGGRVSEREANRAWSTGTRPGPREEVMDDPGLDAADHAAALRGLERINRWSGVGRSLWRVVGRWAHGGGNERGYRVLDVACGGGDVAAALARKAQRAGVAVDVVGCDVSARAVEMAAARWDQGGQRVAFVVADALAERGLPRGFDAVVCTLFLHHLTDAQAVDVLRAMREAVEDAPRCGGIMVLDLRRGWDAWALTWLGVRVLSRCWVVHRDGPASVRAGWTKAELLAVAERAGLAGATVRRCFPLRWALVWERSEQTERPVAGDTR